jgi:hypothetical protein
MTPLIPGRAPSYPRGPAGGTGSACVTDFGSKSLTGPERCPYPVVWGMRRETG